MPTEYNVSVKCIQNPGEGCPDTVSIQVKADDEAAARSIAIGVLSQSYRGSRWEIESIGPRVVPFRRASS